MQEDTSVAKAYTLLRGLGLRHLAVIPAATSVVGVITRHDLLPARLEQTCTSTLTRGAGRWPCAHMLAHMHSFCLCCVGARARLRQEMCVCVCV